MTGKQASLLFLICLLFICNLSAQNRLHSPKFSPLAAKWIASHSQQQKATCYLHFKPGVDIKKLLRENLVHLDAIERFWPHNNSVLINLSHEDIIDWITQDDRIAFVDIRNRRPALERAIPGLDISLNGFNLVEQYAPAIDGSGSLISIREEAFDSTDIDLSNRYVISPFRDETVTAHATIMATLVAGAGNSYFLGRGAAPGASISSNGFQDLFPGEDSYYFNKNISVENHSYGVGIENYYGGEAVAYDDQLNRLPHLLHVFSAGNQGDILNIEGNYADVPGYANLTGNVKMGKNIITVGSLTTDGRVSPLSSRGPAYDGRVKPELVAAGEDGSSGAAALTSGAIALLHQAYLAQTDSLPPNSLIRAILLNSADDLEERGPDFVSGYGNLDAWGALQTIREQRFFSGALSSDSHIEFPLIIPAGARKLKVTLAWTDPAAQPNAAAALINDLDLSLTAQDEGASWLPWVLSSFPHPDSLSLPARRGIDRLNNQEQITITVPEAENYLIRVSSGTLAGNQSFHLAYEWETSGFQWTSPLRDEPVLAGQDRPLRWRTTMEGAGAIDYRLVRDNNWLSVTPETTLATGNFSWPIDPVTGLAQLRMRIGSDTFYSDTFALAQPIDMDLELDCEDQLLLTWESDPNVMQYRLLAYFEDAMRTIDITTDTFALLDRTVYPYQYFSVAPEIEGQRFGFNAQALNVDFQNASCYINLLSGQVIDDGIRLNLQLGSTFSIARINFSRLVNGQYLTIDSVEEPALLNLSALDVSPQNGLNQYRVTIIFEDGSTYDSEVVFVTFSSDAFFVYPNPTLSGEGATLLAKSVPDNASFLLYSSIGRQVLKFSFTNGDTLIPTSSLPAGAYYYEITSNGSRLHSGKLIIGRQF